MPAPSSTPFYRGRWTSEPNPPSPSGRGGIGPSWIRSGAQSGSWLWRAAGACAQGRRVRFCAGGSPMRPRACSLSSNVRAAMSLRRPAALRQFHTSHRYCERAVRCQAGCCSIRACNHARSSPVSMRPWTRIGSTAPTIYPSGRFESSKKMSKLQGTGTPCPATRWDKRPPS